MAPTDTDTLFLSLVADGALTLVSTMQGMPPDVDTTRRVRELLEEAVARAEPSTKETTP